MKRERKRERGGGVAERKGRKIESYEVFVRMGDVCVLREGDRQCACV
jgi:hypothetical protein